MAKLTTDEIFKALSCAAYYAHDGMHTIDGEPILIGLRREEVTSPFEERLMDGFGVTLNGNKMIIKYHCQCRLEEVKEKDFEANIENRFKNIIKYLKSEVKKKTGSPVTLTPVNKETDVDVSYISRIRCWATSQKMYEIQGVESEANEPEERTIDDNIKKFLELAKK